jgi:hypothetical protein
MPCDSRLSEGQTLVQRQREIDVALRRLETALQAGAVKVVVAPNGAVTFAGWSQRSGVNDACAYRALAASGSWALRRAVAAAEATGGRKINERAVASGWHSHDGGGTWGRHE